MQLGGLLVPLLLFADDIVLLGPSCTVVQRLLDALSTFCAESGLTVSLSKTCWLVEGLVHRDFDPGTLYYRGSCLTRVSTFKYLGLVTGGHGLSIMVAAR